ncbi:MAG TPA: amino acid--tRNA ligase-related protein [Polyangiaceae bacterium]|nr:amino acid--tRNA ligase-related protein [Polyangiaceae bacterium]
MSEPPKGTASAEQALIEARRTKADRVRARGQQPFANDVIPRLGSETRDVAALRAAADVARDAAGRYDEARVSACAGGAMFHVRGRIIALRSTGGLSFLRLRDGTGEIQLLVSQAVLGAGYGALADLDVGDFVEAEGTLTASKRGELSLEPRRLRLITKAYRPLPEKWHGLTDVEVRYRQRYVDLVANPAVADVFRARSHVMRATRAILEEHGFIEVETPTMHPLVGGAVARPFVTHHNVLDMRLFMRIAPELYLKRLVVGGLERVYEIGRAYRNEGISTRHNPEFTILELYQAYATYEDLIRFTEVILRGVDARLQAAMPSAYAAWKEARPFTLDEPFVRVTMDRAVAEAARRTQIPEWATAVDRGGGFALVGVLRDGFAERIKGWARQSSRAGAIDWGNFRKAVGSCESDGEKLFACYEYMAEPFLVDDYRSVSGSHSVPVFVKDYPFEVSPLARRNDDHAELTDRFEIFVHGRELGNGFSELNDPDDQAARFRAQVERKARGDEESMDYDEDYVRALEHGMPPTAGFGMGIDRLVMMLTNAASIRDVIFFPLLRSEPGQNRSNA